MLTVAEFDALVRARGTGLVSLYLPTHRFGPETRQGPIRLRQLVNQAHELCAARGLDRRTASTLLEPADELAEQGSFWEHQEQGLALLVSPDGLTVHKLATTVDALAFVGERYCVRPLLPAVDRGRRFYILAVSQHDVRLLEGSDEGVRELELPDVPHDLRDVVGYDWEQNVLQYHTGAPAQGAHRRGGSVEGGQRPALFHGHGGGRDETKPEIERFLRRVDEGVLAHVEDRQAPLVVAGVDFVQAMYRAVSRHPHVLADGVDGSPEPLDAGALHAAARELVLEHLAADERESVQRVTGAAHSSRVVVGVAAVLPVASSGRVERLLVSGPPVWGRFDEPTSTVEVHGERTAVDDDLLDLAVAYVVGAGGSVHAVAKEDLPSPEPVAALLRF